MLRAVSMVGTLLAMVGIAGLLAITALVSYRNGFDWNRRTISVFLGSSSAAYVAILLLD
jgi:hypothetical protein